MQIYIANCTQQNHVINFRVPEFTKLFTHNIPMGRQIPIADRNGFNQLQVDAIIQQLERYGLVAVEKLSGKFGVIPYVYSIDKPVKAETIARVVDHNRGVLRADGKERRLNAAIAAVDAAENAGPLREVEVSIEQVTDGTLPTEGDKVEEGYIMSKTPDGDARGQVKNTRRGNRRGKGQAQADA